MFKTYIKKIFSKFGFKISRTDVIKDPQDCLPVTTDHFFDMYFSCIDKKDFFLLQLGANDGLTRDTINSYIKRYTLNALLVEPQTAIYNKLKRNYEKFSNVKIVNVAIGTQNGKAKFLTVKPELINEDNFFETTAIASIDRETIRKAIKKRIPNIIKPLYKEIDDYIEEIEVDCLTYNSLLEMYKLPEVTFLFTDCEGHDFEIIKSINFNRHKPQVINFESKWLSKDDREECEGLLRSHGYKLFRYGNDTCAFLVQ